MDHKNKILLATVFWFALCGCKGPERNVQDTGKINVFASILPQAYLVERIGGHYVSVEALLGENQDPHTFEPTPTQLGRLSKADIYFTIGIPFERQFIDKIREGRPNMVIISNDEGVPKRMMISYLHEHRGETMEDNHGQGQEPDPHIWLAPKNIERLARTITQTLMEAAPEQRNLFNSNLDEFLADLNTADKNATEILEPFEGRSFYVFHPAFGYFADAYGLQQKAVEIEGKSPTPKQLHDLITRAREEQVKIILVQPQFDPKSAQSIAQAIGGIVIPMDPMGKDVLGNLDDLCNKIQMALSME
jgi:zinc transport system substrate-binding protein